MAVASYTKITQSRAHAEFLSWGWDVLLKLKLHESDVHRDNGDEENATGDNVRPEGIMLSHFFWYKRYKRFE